MFSKKFKKIIVIFEKLSAFSSLAEKGIDVEAKKLLDEMKQQQEEQAKLMQQQVGDLAQTKLLD